MSDGFEVIATTLLASQMRVDAHVTSRAGQALVLREGDVLARLRVDVLFRQPEVDYVYAAVFVERLSTDEEVLGLDVAKDQVALVHVLDALEELNGDHAHGLDAEFAIAQVEQVLQIRPQKFHDECVVFAALTVKEYLRNSFFF